MDVSDFLSTKAFRVLSPNFAFNFTFIAVLEFSGSEGIVAGWGRTAEKQQTSQLLQTVSVPVWSREECKSAGYGSKRITENMICSGYAEGGKDACQVSIALQFCINSSITYKNYFPRVIPVAVWASMDPQEIFKSLASFHGVVDVDERTYPVSIPMLSITCHGSVNVWEMNACVYQSRC